MIIYNVTINVDLDIAAEWLAWMQTKHIPDVMNTGMFISQRMLKLMGDEDSGGITYAVQYECKDMETLLKYREEFAPALMNDTKNRFGDKFVAFRTVLEVVE